MVPFFIFHPKWSVLSTSPLLGTRTKKGRSMKKDPKIIGFKPLLKGLAKTLEVIVVHKDICLLQAVFRIRDSLPLHHCSQKVTEKSQNSRKQRFYY